MMAQPRPYKRPAYSTLLRGLVLWLPMDDRSGRKSYDMSGKGNHGTLNLPTWVAEKRGAALRFDGIDDEVDCGAQASLNVDYATISLWINGSKANNYQGPIIKIYDSNYRPFEFYFSPNSGRITFNASNSTSTYYALTSTTGTDVLDGDWYNVVATVDSSLIKIYIDGIFNRQTAFSGVMMKSTENVKIGKSMVAYFNGMIYDVRIYNRALTAAEVKRLYEGGRLKPR